jgi:hypothetical protein
MSIDDGHRAMNCFRCAAEVAPDGACVFTLSLKPLLPKTDPITRTVVVCDNCVERYDFDGVALSMAKAAWSRE